MRETVTSHMRVKSDGTVGRQKLSFLFPTVPLNLLADVPMAIFTQIGAKWVDGSEKKPARRCSSRVGHHSLPQCPTGEKGGLILHTILNHNNHPSCHSPLP